MMTQECDFCDLPATRRVSAQWTVVDWDTYYTCEAHFVRCWQWLERRRIVGLPPQEMFSSTVSQGDVP